MKNFIKIFTFIGLLIVSNNAFAIQENVVVGKKDAPIEIRVYYSLACPACSRFYKYVYNKIKKNYVETGIAFVEFRPYPMDEKSFALDSILTCIDTAEKHEQGLDVLLLKQNDWKYADNMLIKVEELLAPYISKEELEKCYVNEASAKQLYDKIDGYKKKRIVDGTPAVFINGVHIENESYYNVSKHIKELNIK